jgi:hypothetical protein
VLEKQLLWEQEQPILDAVRVGGDVVVLDGARVLLMRGGEQQSTTIAATHSWPRDLRGRLSVSGSAFTAWLPGTICQGGLQPQLTVSCRDSQDPWLLAPGAIATFSAARNYFTGRLDVAPGGTRDAAPFYSAAVVPGGWIFNGASEQWGSDIAGIETSCGTRVLATRPSGPSEPDAIQPYEMGGAEPAIAGPPLEFSGPVTALWSTGASATAVSRDLQTGRYAAYSLAGHCGS